MFSLRLSERPFGRISGMLASGAEFHIPIPASLSTALKPMLISARWLALRG